MYGEGIIKGMATAIRTFFRKPFTVQYPMEKQEPEKRYRGALVLYVDENGEPLCRACGICARNCPDRLPHVTSSPEKKNKAFSWDIFFGRCLFCGICTETCPFQALGWTREYEWASTDKNDLTVHLMIEGRVLRSQPAPRPEKPADPGKDGVRKDKTSETPAVGGEAAS